MTWLLRLYPRDWRHRYGGEVEMLVANERPSFRLFLDLLAGAVDARLNPQPIPKPKTSQGDQPMSSIKRLCARSPFTVAEQSRSAAWMLGSALAFASLGLALSTLGQELLSQAVLYAGFPMAFILSNKSTYLKDYSPVARWTLILGGMVGMFLFMLLVTYFADSVL